MIAIIPHNACLLHCYRPCRFPSNTCPKRAMPDVLAPVQHFHHHIPVGVESFVCLRRRLQSLRICSLLRWMWRMEWTSGKKTSVVCCIHEESPRYMKQKVAILLTYLEISFRSAIDNRVIGIKTMRRGSLFRHIGNNVYWTHEVFLQSISMSSQTTK